MEMNLWSDMINIDHPVDLVCSTHGGDGADGQGSKLYTCTFCKKGFSNAQALGGHMNVHRKDRARLKEDQSSEEETLVLVNDQKCSEETTSAAQQEDHHPHQSSRGEDEKSSTLKRLWLFPEEDDIDCASPRKKDASLGGDHVVQLPLFVDMTSTNKPSDIRDLKNEASRFSPSSSSRTKDELDLELRLGSDS